MSTVSTEQVLDVLGYAESPNYRLTSDQHHPLTAISSVRLEKQGQKGFIFFTPALMMRFCLLVLLCTLLKRETPERG